MPDQPAAPRPEDVIRRDLGPWEPEACAALDALAAERDRYREALDKIALQECVLTGSARSTHRGEFCPAHVARAALAGGTP